MKILEIANELLAKLGITAKIKSSFIKAGIVAVVVVSLGVMNPVETNAQIFSPAIEVRSWVPFIMIGPNDPVNRNASQNHCLTFGKGNNSDNCGQWVIVVDTFGLNITRAWNAPYGPTTGPNATARSALYLDTNARVGVAYHIYNRPQYTLDVWGIARANNQILTSDKRYKRNITPITSNLDNLLKLQGVAYNKSGEAYNEMLDNFKQANKDDADNEEIKTRISAMENYIRECEADKRINFGFIAQELREVYPDLVYEDEYGYLSVNYTGLIPVLVEAIKELKTEINELKGKGFEKTTATVISTAKLYQNNPNPFNENTEIKYYVPEDASEAMICIYDLTGSQIVRFDLRQKGYSSLTVRGRELKAGMYIYALLVDGKEIDSKRMILTDK